MKLHVKCVCCNEALIIDTEIQSVRLDEDHSLENDQKKILEELGIEFG